VFSAAVLALRLCGIGVIEGVGWLLPVTLTTGAGTACST
jgi:hypothetical protein